MTFKRGLTLGGLKDTMPPLHRAPMDDEKATSAGVNVSRCPYNAVMDAVGRRRIDHFSLDVEDAPSRKCSTRSTGRVIESTRSPSSTSCIGVPATTKNKSWQTF